MPSKYINTLTSFSGADLVCTFANKVVGELQQISWAIQRQKAPVFTLGSADARSFSRGKRGIAGSLSMAVFDQDALVETLKESWEQIAPAAMFSAAGNIAKSKTENFQNAFDLSQWNAVAEDQLGDGDVGFVDNSEIDAATAPASNPAEAGQADINVPAGFSTIRAENVLYADTLPPFDITMTFANEYGQSAFQKIYDVDILNEGSGVSVDSMVMERQITYIARRMSPLLKGIYTRSEGGDINNVDIHGKAVQ